MADFDSTFRYDSDFTKVTDDIKALVREATHANSVFAQLNKTAASVKMEAARSFAAQAGFAGFKTQIVDLTGATEKFGEQLMKNKLTMKEYFKEAAQAYKKDSKARILAEREVRRAQSGVVNIGDINGRRRGMLVTPQALDMKNASVQLKVASKQYEIFNDLVQKGSTALVNWGKNTQWAGRQLTVGLTVPMGIFASQALKAFADVDKEITRFRKVYGSDLTGTVGDATDQMVEQIRGMGAEFAKQYGIASKETIALAADLAAAGLEGERLANSVNQTTRMIVLGEVDRQEAMKATLSIQTAFNQSSKELAQSVDFLNAVENQTSASLQDLVEAIPKTGPVIQALGGDIKDLAVLMTAMREGGINAAEGANALKSGMASLISPTTKATALAKQFGIDLEGIVQKNRGELMPMLLDFQDALSGLDSFGKAKLIEEIFGKYQFARISALFDNLNQRGSQTVGMVKLLKASSDELAKKSYSELKAQENAPSTRLAAMQQTLQENLIKVGADLAETLLPIMQGALDILQKIVEGFNNLPEPIKNFVKIIGGITAAAGPILMLAGIFGNLIGNAIKFGMSIVNMFKKLTGHPVETLQILSDEELAAKLAADQLTNAYHRQKTSVMELNAALNTYIANLRNAAQIAPPGAVAPGGTGPFPRRFKTGGVVYAKNGVDSGGRINGYGGGDTVPAMLEQGEFVINKKSSRKYAPLLKAINQGKDIPGYQHGKTDGYGPDIIREVFRSTDPGAGTGSSVDVYKYLSDKESKASATSIIKELRMLPQTPEIVELLRAIDISDTQAQAYKRQWGLAASHLTESGFAVSVGDRKAIKKNYIGTSALESYGYNSLIQDIAPGDSSLSKTKILQGKIPSDYPDRAQLLRILSSTSAPIDPNDIKILNSFFKDMKTNPVLRTAFLTESGTVTKSNPLGRPSEDKMGKLNESLKYLDELEQIILRDEAKIAAGKQTGYTEYANLRKNQIIGATIVTLPNNVRAALLKQHGYEGLIRMIGQGVDRVTGPLASGKLKGAQLRAWTRTSMLDLSRDITDRDVLGSREIAELENTDEYGKRKSFNKQKLPSSKIGTLSGVSKVASYVARRFGKPFAKGGPVGGIFEKMVLGVRAKSLKQEELDAVNAQMTTAAAGRTLFSGGISDTAWLSSLKPGDTVRIPGATSLSDDISTAQYFTKKHMPGGAYNNIQRQYTKDELRAMGLNENLLGWKTATTQEESMEMLRGLRIDELLKLRDARERMKALKQKKISIQSSPYPSQVGTMFPQEPLPHEVIARNKELAQIDREILRAQSSDWSAKQNLERYRTHAKVYGRSTPTTAAFVTREGTPYLPITGNVTPGSLQAGVSLAEQESIISDMNAVFLGYREHNGVSIPTFEIASAAPSLSISEKKPWGLKNGGEVSPMRMQKFAFGGRVGKWNTPIGEGERGYEEAVAWRSDKMSDFRKLKVQDVLTDPVPGRRRRIKYSKLATNPLFNKDKLYNLLSTLGNVPAGIPLMRATTLNPGVSTEFSSEQQLRIMNALRTENYDDIFGMPLNQKGLASYTSMDPRTGAYGLHGLGIFFRRNSPGVYGDNPRTGRSRFEEVRTGSGRIEKYPTGYAVNDGSMYVGPHGMEQVLFSHTTSGAERGRVISHPDSKLDELLTYRTDAVVDAISSEWSPGAKYGRTIIHTRGIDPTIQGPVRLATGGKLPGFGGGDKIPAMLEPGEFIINKDSAKKYGAVLDRINKDGLPGFALGGRVGALAEQAYDRTGGMIGMAGNLAFLPMTVEQAKTAGNDFVGMLTKFTAIVQMAGAAVSMLGAASKASAAMQLGFGKIGKISSAARAGQIASKTGDKFAAGLSTARAGGGKVMQSIAMKSAGKGMMSGLARTALMGARFLPGIGIGVTALMAGYALFQAWKSKANEWAAGVADTYGEATEMAKVYNIELKKTSEAMAKNTAAAQSLGMAMRVIGKGQVDIDYGKAVQKDYGKAIERVKSLATAQEKANELTLIYTSMITQGFSAAQAKETTAEISRQASATEAFSLVVGDLTTKVRTVADAMHVMVTSFEAQIGLLGTAEEKVAAFTGAYENLVRQSYDNPLQFGLEVDNLVSAMASSGELRNGLEAILGKAGFGSDSKMFQNFFANVGDLSTEEGQKSAGIFVRAVQAGLDASDLVLPVKVLEQKVQEVEASKESKKLQDEIMRQKIDFYNKQIDEENKIADKKIKWLEDEMDKAQKAHDKAMKNLEDENEKLRERADIIGDNTDYYISQLEKEYNAEQYYQSQRETALGGLESLSKGDIFGYLKAQTQAASDAEQFGREQAIAQIQDTRDAALKVIQLQIDANDKARQGMDDAFNNQMDNFEKRIEDVNITRSKAIKGIQKLIDMSQEFIDTPVGDATAKQLQQIETKAGEVAKNTTKSVGKAITEASSGLVESFRTNIDSVVLTIAQDTGMSKKAAAALTSKILDNFSSKVAGGKGEQGGKGGDSGTPKDFLTPSTEAKSLASIANVLTNLFGQKQKTQQPQLLIGGTAYPLTAVQGVQYKYNKGGKVLKFANGNVVPGTGNKDTVSAMLTPGEFVVNKNATSKNLALLKAINNGARIGYNMGGKAPEYNMPSNRSEYGRNISEIENKVVTISMPTTVNINGGNTNAETAQAVFDVMKRVQKSLSNSIGGS